MRYHGKPLLSRAGLVATVLATVLLPSCAAEDTPQSGSETDAPLTTPTTPPADWQVSGKPTLQIGAEDGPAGYLFSGPLQAYELADGNVVVATHHTAELRLYDSTGKYLRSLGRMGAGPGEFRDIGGALALAAGDTILAGLATEVNWFTSLGDFVDQRRWDRDGLTATAPRRYRMSQAWALPDAGLLLAFQCDTGDCVTGTRTVRSSVRYYYFSVPGAEPVAAGTGRGIEVLSAAYAQEAGLTWPVPPFFRRPLVRFGGTPLRIYMGERGSQRVQVFDTQSHTRDELVLPLPRRQLTAAHLERHRNALLREGGPERAATLDATWAAVGIPDTMPLSDFIVDRGGMLWVELPATSGSTTWWVFDGSGVPAGSVTIPAELRLLDAGDDYLWAEHTDEFGVPYLRRHELERGSTVERGSTGTS